MRTVEKVGWLLIGAAAGAGIALLYAPRSGRETRKIIRRSAEDARDAIVDKGEDILDAGRQVYRKGVDVAQSAADVFNRARAQVRS
jgi:gas vesicle protein